jgi:hypothetical protein
MLDIQVTDGGLSAEDPAAKRTSVALTWKNPGAFADLLVRRLTDAR